jgi:hypothetical protein
VAAVELVQQRGHRRAGNGVRGTRALQADRT